MHISISVNDQDDFSIPFPQKCPHTLDENSATTILWTRQTFLLGIKNKVPPKKNYQY